jgi:hypothetical protein
MACELLLNLNKCVRKTYSILLPSFFSLFKKNVKHSFHMTS